MLCDRTSYPLIAKREKQFYGEMIERYRGHVDKDTAEILQRRLVDGQSEVQVSLEMHYSRETINRKFHRGLEKINDLMKLEE